MLYNLFENRDFISVFAVALLAEGVDRNWVGLWTVSPQSVASSRRAWIEILMAAQSIGCATVALLAEGVDRNYNAKAVEVSTPSHPPCRGYR